MKKDQWIGLFFVVGSIVTAVILNQILYRAEAGFRLEMYILPALGVLIGALFFFTNFESTVNLKETIEELPESLSDDLEAIKSGQVTFPVTATMFSIIALIWEIWLIFFFRKWNAEWFGVSVLLISTIVAIGTAILCFRSEWFQDRYERLSKRIFIIPAVGFAICALLGSYYAEPQGYGQLSPLEQDMLARSEQYSQESRGSQFFYMMGRSASSSSSSIEFDCDEEGCLVILLMIIVIVSVIGSALIPHFWLLATMLLLTIMLMVSLRELLFYKKRVTYRHW